MLKVTYGGQHLILIGLGSNRYIILYVSSIVILVAVISTISNT